MDFYPYMTEIQENHLEAEKKRARRPRAGFLDMFDAQLEKRRLEKRAGARAVLGGTPALPLAGGCEPPSPNDFSMYKLYLSMLLRHGGAAPLVAPGAANASAVMRTALSNWDAGSRGIDARDSDLFSMPRFPVVRFKQI